MQIRSIGTECLSKKGLHCQKVERGDLMSVFDSSVSFVKTLKDAQKREKERIKNEHRSNRLTFKDSNGLIGIKAEYFRPSPKQTIPCTANEVVKRLYEYENLIVDIHKPKAYENNGKVELYCPLCAAFLDGTFKNYCGKCGAKLCESE